MVNALKVANITIEGMNKQIDVDSMADLQDKMSDYVQQKFEERVAEFEFDEDDLLDWLNEIVADDIGCTVNIDPVPQNVDPV